MKDKSPSKPQKPGCFVRLDAHLPPEELPRCIAILFCGAIWEIEELGYPTCPTYPLETFAGKFWFIDRQIEPPTRP